MHLEYMTEVTAAPAAVHFGPHAQQVGID